MMSPTSHELPIYIRAYTEPVDADPPDRSRRPKPDWPEYWLAFDTETTTDPTQTLLFGSFRVGTWNEQGRPLTLGEGLFHGDDLAERRPEGRDTLEQYAAHRLADVADHPDADPGFRLLSRAEFIREVLWPFAWELQALVVGFNLPFDLTRVAADAGSAKEIFYNGFSLPLLQYEDQESGSKHDHPHVGRFRVKTIDSKRALLGLTRPKQGSGEKSFRGRLLDLRTLAFALTNKSHSLASACRESDARHVPHEAGEHGELAFPYIDYNRQDVRATVALLAELREEYDRHPIPAPPDDLLSPASVAKAYLDAMGIEPPRATFDVAKRMYGWGMCAFYGGRAEVKVRRVDVPVVYSDFKSMYPTVNALMGMGDVLRADQLRLKEVTDEIQKLLEDVTLGDCFKQDRWPDLRFLGKIRPQGDMLPVRSDYDPESQNRNIGLNPLHAEEPIVYAGPDLLASTLLTGRVPDVLEAYRLVPEGTQDGSQTVELRGEVEIDPRTEDIFQRIIEHRKDPERPGSQEEEDRLGDFLKVLANSGSYGIFAEMVRNVRPDDAPEEISVFDRDENGTAETSHPEHPGPFCFPPIAALIASAARLMLAMLERCVRNRGGEFVFCDTDSMAVVASEDSGLVPCPGGEHELPDGNGAIRALSWQEVDEIIERFEQLKPYDSAKVPGGLLEIEDENFRNKDPTNERLQLHCLAISAKRYALFRSNGSGSMGIVKNSEHGLGHLLNPRDPESESKDWMAELWLYLIALERGEDPEEPDWLDHPAVSRLTISTRNLQEPFEDRNEGRPYQEQIKPMNFMLVAHTGHYGAPADVEPGQPFQLIAPYTSDPTEWRRIPWHDKYGRGDYYITTSDRGTAERVRVQSYQDVFERYRRKPEVTALGPDGKICGKQTRGVLQPRPVRGATVIPIGKESNRLDEVQAGAVQQLDEVLATYDSEDKLWEQYLRPRLVKLVESRSKAAIARSLGVSQKTVQRWKNGHTTPSRHQTRISALVEAACSSSTSGRQ